MSVVIVVATMMIPSVILVATMKFVVRAFAICDLQYYGFASRLETERHHNNEHLQQDIRIIVRRITITVTRLNH